MKDQSDLLDNLTAIDYNVIESRLSFLFLRLLSESVQQSV